jgi:glycosyltransferase involved in cell wall biosynthesis
VAEILRVAIAARSVHGLHGFGGLERHVDDLVRHLARLGAEVTLITKPARTHPTDPLPATVLEVPYLTFPGAGRRGTTVIDRSSAYLLFGWRAGRRAAALVRQGRIDVVHGLGASVLGYAVARRREAGLSAPLVFNPQGLEEFGATDPARARLKRIAYRPLQAAVRVCARAADAVVATDSSLRPVALGHLDVDPARVVTIPNAVDVERVTGLASRDQGRHLRRHTGIADDEWLLLSVGRIEQNKGFDVMLRALASLDPKVPAWRWVLVGDGPWRARLARDVATSGLASRIMMRGREDEPTLHAWYEAADAFVHPTLYEGSSLVTLEAMVHGLPVVATRAGGIPDKVRPGENGWLVAPGDPDDLAAALRALFAARVQLPALGARSRRIVDEQFAWPAVAAATLALYRRLRHASSR